jgi:hypothetical protein
VIRAALLSAVALSAVALSAQGCAVGYDGPVEDEGVNPRCGLCARIVEIPCAEGERCTSTTSAVAAAIAVTRETLTLDACSTLQGPACAEGGPIPEETSARTRR